jgi:hypothetical protein
MVIIRRDSDRERQAEKQRTSIERVKDIETGKQNDRQRQR